LAGTIRHCVTKALELLLKFKIFLFLFFQYLVTMPKFTKRSHHPKRKSVRRRTHGPARAARAVNLSHNLGPIPQRMITKLKYCDAFARTSTLGILNTYQFNLNSIFDPDLTGTGHQPYGRDTYATLYNRYRVFAVSWAIDAAIDVVNANNAYNAQITVLPQNSSTTYTSLGEVAEKPRAITKLAPNVGKTTSRGHISLPNLNGQTSTEYKGDDRFQALMGSNPAEIMTLSICFASPDATTVNVGLSYTVRLIYHCEFFDPLVLARS